MVGRSKTVKQAPRLAKCLEAGEVTALFPLLKDWSKEELLALTKEIEEFAWACDEGIENVWKTYALQPEHFLNASSAKALDRIRDDAKLHVVQTCSEILSVAQFYLARRRTPRGGE